jgi:hypothetical protein
VAVALVRAARPLAASLALLAVGSAGCSDDDDGLDDAACEVLLAEARPAVDGRGPASLADALRTLGKFSLAGEPSVVRVFVAPDQVGELELVAEDVEQVAGASVVDLRDQAESFDDFVELFGAEQPEMVAVVDEESMPATVEVMADDDDALADLHDRFDADPRVFRVVDDRATLGSFVLLAAGFGDELEALGPEHPAAAAVLDAIESTSSEGAPPSSGELRSLRSSVDELLLAADEDCEVDPPE